MGSTASSLHAWDATSEPTRIAELASTLGCQDPTARRLADAFAQTLERCARRSQGDFEGGSLLALWPPPEGRAETVAAFFLAAKLSDLAAAAAVPGSDQLRAFIAGRLSELERDAGSGLPQTWLLAGLRYLENSPAPSSGSLFSLLFGLLKQSPKDLSDPEEVAASLLRILSNRPIHYDLRDLRKILYVDRPGKAATLTAFQPRSSQRVATALKELFGICNTSLTQAGQALELFDTARGDAPKSEWRNRCQALLAGAQGDTVRVFAQWIQDSSLPPDSPEEDAVFMRFVKASAWILDES